eukprot:scaffold36144_cov72-Phaeocystis_antarctica.AAC.1
MSLPLDRLAGAGGGRAGVGGDNCGGGVRLGDNSGGCAGGSNRDDEGGTPGEDSGTVGGKGVLGTGPRGGGGSDGGTLVVGDGRGGGGGGVGGSGSSWDGCAGEGGLSGNGGGGVSIGPSSNAQLASAASFIVTQARVTSCARWTRLDAPVGQSSKRQLASAASRVLVLVSGSPPWYICSWWQPSGRLRLAIVLLNPEWRLKLRSTAALLSALTTNFRSSHPSPKLSNSCSLTRTVASGEGTAADGGGGEDAVPIVTDTDSTVMPSTAQAAAG